jgi:hypothetical protein
MGDAPQDEMTDFEQRCRGLITAEEYVRRLRERIQRRERQNIVPREPGNRHVMWKRFK